MVLGAIAAAWFPRRRAPVLSFGLAWSAVGFLAISNVAVATGILLAERTLVLPSIGFVLAAGAVAEVVLSWDGGRRAWAGRALGVATAALVVAGVARSAERHRIWQNEATYVVRSTQDAPRSWRMQRVYGQLLFASGDRHQAITVYQRAIAFAPQAHVWRVRNDLARRLWEVGANELAVEQLRVSLSEAPDKKETRYYLVLGYLTLGAYAEAAREAESALARGFSPEVFGELRAVADAAMRAGAPPGSLRIRMRAGSEPR